MRIHRLINVLILLVLLAISAYSGQAVSANDVNQEGVATLKTWNQIAVDTIVSKAPNPSVTIVPLASVHAAMFDAVNAIQGGFAPYALEGDVPDGASVDAAIAQAAHDVLVAYFPGDQTLLDLRLTVTLMGVTDGDAKDAGVAVGQAAAAALLASRAGDGYMADIGYTVGDFQPGIWQPLQGQAPAIPWLSQMRPFLLKSHDQFRPNGPPALGSQRYTKDYNEVKQVGGAISATRTADQTDASRFFAGHAALLYNPVTIGLIDRKNLSTAESARWLALTYMVVADSSIACYDAKYTYNFWRPIIAIQKGDLDGNPDTAADPTWTSLIPTPPFPEYVSGHGCATGSTAEMWAALVGNRNINVTIRNDFSPNLATRGRFYKTSDQLQEEIINVRVWSGIHFRTSDVEGVKIGVRVAEYALERFLLPTK